MADKRMFSKRIIDSDAFIDMPSTARLLYFDLSMRADDDGFVNSPKKIMRMTGATQDDLSILLLRKFVIGFENGIVVIKHWRIHNYIRKDTYHETTYIDQKKQLIIDENGAYKLANTVEKIDRPRIDDEPATQTRQDKTRLDKTRQAQRPTRDEIRQYIINNVLNVNADEFFERYEMTNWEIDGEKIHDWRALLRAWHKHNGHEFEGVRVVPVPEYIKKQIQEGKEKK